MISYISVDSSLIGFQPIKLTRTQIINLVWNFSSSFMDFVFFSDLDLGPTRLHSVYFIREFNIMVE